MLSAPFPWFGGKSAVADVVWRAFGDVSTFVEPFAGSLAVLLRRPTEPRIETVNDVDGFIANFWRAISNYPDTVALFADWPVNEADLHARHAWLVGQRTELTERLMGDPEYCDPKIAGWWVWGLSCWIGAEWCSGKGPWTAIDGRLVHVGDGQGTVVRKAINYRPGKGVHVERIYKKRPAVDARGGKGVNGIVKTRPHLGTHGMGVHRQLPQITGIANGNGVHQRFDAQPNGRGVAGRHDDLRAWMRALSDRLRRVRVTCGDWTRVTGPSVIRGNGVTGILLDPPYPDVGDDLYAQDGAGVAELVHRWAIEHGEDDRLRIAVCGYAGDFEWPDSWREHSWKARGGYGSQENAARERIWFSRACLDFTSQLELGLQAERCA